MKRPRFSIAGLMKVIVLAAVVAAAFRDPTENWTFVVFCLGLAFLVEATLRARFGPDRDRAWWFGFSLFGWIHLGLGLTHDCGFLPTYFFMPQAIFDWLSRIGYNQTRNGDLIINVILSLIVALLGGTLTSWYVKRWSVPPIGAPGSAARESEGDEARSSSVAPAR